MPRDDGIAAALAELLGDSDAEPEPLAPSASPISVDELDVATRRRQLHAQVVARSRNRQRERVALLVKQETALRKQLTRLIQSRNARGVQDAYAALVASQQELLAANDALEELVHRHYLFGRFVQFERSNVLDEGDEDAAPRASKKPSRNEKKTKKTTESSDQARGVWLRFLAGDAPIFFEYESPAQSAYLVSVCFHLGSYLESAFDADTHLRVDEAHVLGWRARRAIHWNDELQKKMLYFKFSRRVVSSQATLVEIQQRSWAVLSTPEMQARLYSVPVATQLAQQIDENAQIVFQHKAYHMPVWFYSLNVQALEPGVVRQSMMVLDKPPPTEHGPSNAPIVWLREGIICLTFRAVGDAVEVEFAGCMRCLDERHAQFMLIDVGCVLVRWENLVLPSRLLL